jgi:hypothetical protein
VSAASLLTCEHAAAALAARLADALTQSARRWPG